MESADVTGMLLVALAIGVPALLVYIAIRSVRRAMERANYEMDLARCEAERDRQLNARLERGSV